MHLCGGNYVAISSSQVSGNFNLFGDAVILQPMGIYVVFAHDRCEEASNLPSISDSPSCIVEDDVPAILDRSWTHCRIVQVPGQK